MSADNTNNQNPSNDNTNNPQQDPSAASTATDANQINGKSIIEGKVTGVVKWFNVKSGYGFITRDDNKEDIFVHQTAIIRNNPEKYLRSVDDGEQVEFAIVQGEKGLEAVNVTGPNGDNVRGSKYAANRRETRGRGGGRGGPGRGQFRGGRRGRPPMSGHGGPFISRGNMQPGFMPQQQFNNYGPPVMPPPFAGPPRGYGPGPIIRGGRGRPPFTGDYPFNPDFQGRGRFFRGGRGGPMMGGPMGPPMGPQMGPPMPNFRGRGRGRIFGRGFNRGRPFRGRGFNRGNFNNSDGQDNDQSQDQGDGQ